MLLSSFRLVLKSFRRGVFSSLLLAFSLLAVLSLLMLLHAAHLLHGNSLTLHLPGRLSDATLWEVNLDRWIDKADTERLLSGQKCVHPDLQPFDPSIMQYYEKETAVDCSSATENWVYVRNGTFYISRRARRLYGKITCEYAPIIRGDDFSARHASHVKPMLNGTLLQSDFFKVACISASGHKYMNIHSAVAWSPTVHQRIQNYADVFRTESRPRTSIPESWASLNLKKQDSKFFLSPTQSLNLSVFMFGFDSLSRMSWMRLLPRSREYFLKELGGIELKGYNIVGDGTPAALLPILTGKMEEELPEARRGFAGATTVDSHPWIWKEFSKHGYVTAHAEDMPNVGTFQLRMLGFKDQPTDHQMRTFYLAAERMYKHNPPLCLGSVTRHVNFMNWFRDLFDMYRNYPKFFFGFHSEMSHDSNNKVQTLDDDLVDFLEHLEESGHLNNTLLILMADHGARYDYIRATAQGKLEERMPYFSFRFPPWFRKQHPDIIKNLEINSRRLTTPFDIHETFVDFLNYTGSGKGSLRRRGISLFKEVPKERTCSDAGITPHWCACLGWQRLNHSDSFVVQAVDAAISTINNFTSTKRTVCAVLTLSEITRSARYVPNSDDRSAEETIEKYAHSSRPDDVGSTPTQGPVVELYQVSFKTEPGDGHFEVTCSRDVISGSFSVSSKDISRINKYGSHPSCIQKSMPSLRPYCYCV